VQESITVQAYLESREAMLRLDEELGFREHFSQDEIDPLTRIADDATVEDAYDTYLRNLRSATTHRRPGPDGGDRRRPTGQPGFSEALIRYAEERVDQMSQRLREDQMAGAGDSFEDAENVACWRRRNACSTCRNSVASCRPRPRCRPCSADPELRAAAAGRTPAPR
jgi:capsular polysaccharide transport system permease protein